MQFVLLISAAGPCYGPELKEVAVSDHATVLFQFSRPRTTFRFPRGLACRLALMWEARRTRRILAELDPRQLKDIGVSRSEAEAEAARAPWDIGPR